MTERAGGGEVPRAGASAAGAAAGTHAGAAGRRHDVLPDDAGAALLIGRVWDPETGGPRPVSLRATGDDAQVHDLFEAAPTVAGLVEQPEAAQIARTVDRPRWRLSELLRNQDRSQRDRSQRDRSGQDPSLPHLLSPIDLQVIKACGVTFAGSMVERVIEERSAGDVSRAAALRAEVEAALAAFPGGISAVQPGSAEAARIKEVLTGQGLWSQYLEVGLGADPEVFTKAPVLSSVGHGAQIGIPAFSHWNNPEPELVLVVDSTGRARGATLGNDVNLRDVEGRSALLLGMAKDNNASAAIGPFIRLFDDRFTADTLRREEISLRVEGADSYLLEGSNHVARLSRTFEELIDATVGAHHQYPDGLVLYTGTLFAPTQDRDEAGLGFTHKLGDTVSISSPHLGTLRNEVGRTEELPPWDFGIRSLTTYLATAASRSLPNEPGGAL